MKESAVEAVVNKTRKAYKYGVAVIFEGRCLQAYPDGKDFEIHTGCYSKKDGLPEFEAIQAAGTIRQKDHDMGRGLIKVTATMTVSQYRTFLSMADGADWEE